MPGDSASGLAEYVRTRRLRAALTQEELAERSALTVDTVGALERGLRRRLFPHTARALADALEFSPAERSEFFELAQGRSRTPGGPPPAPASPPAGDPGVAEPREVAPAVEGIGPAHNRSHNLPMPLTRLIGREAELAQVLKRLPGVRLLTLTGPGGMGKTRLAVEAAWAAQGRYRDGVWLAELAPIADSELVLSVIAVLLGVRESPGRPLVAALGDALRERELLLILDNCEQVLEAAPDVAALLTACPGLTVLATSRAPLRISGEQEMVVPPLGMPLESRQEEFERVARYAAVQLFVERAAAVKADFALTQENAPAVAAICARLDGLPLAIELAAARIKLFSPQALLTRLGRRLDLLTGGPQDRPSRQRTLRAAIAWSYDLLSEPEQALFRRLGVFVGGFTLDAAAAVCSEGSADSMDLLDTLAALLDRSLLQQDDGEAALRSLSVFGEGDGPEDAGASPPRKPQTDAQEPRFAMFETIREFAIEQIETRGEVERWSQRHLRYYLGVIEQQETNLGEATPVETIWRTRRRLSLENGNFRAALIWAATRAQGEDSLRLAGSMCALWAPALNSPVARRWLDQSAGTLREAQSWLEQSLALAATPGEHRAKALYGLGRVLYFQWDEWEEHMAELDYAIRVFDESLSLYRGLGDRRAVTRCLLGLAWALYERGNNERAATVFEEQLALSQELDAPGAGGWSLIGLGRIAMMAGENDKAGAVLEEGLALQRRAGNQLGIAAALDALGLLRQTQRDHGGAMACFEEAVALRRAGGAGSGLPPALQRIGVLFAARGEIRRGAELLLESLVLSQRMGGHPSDTAIGLLALGAIAGILGQPELGARLIGAGEALFEATGLVVPLAFQGLNRRTVDNVRRALGDEAYLVAHALGRTQPLEQAVAQAMQVAAEAARSGAG